jgi:hypothetical protein
LALIAPGQVSLDFLGAEGAAAYGRYYPGLLDHVRNAEHRWEANPTLTKCARPSLTTEGLINLSYENCSKLAPTALQAVTILLKASLSAVAAPADFSLVDVLATNLATQWEKQAPQQAMRAREFSLIRPTVGGIWNCRNGATVVPVQVYDEGLFQATISLNPFASGPSVRFENFLSLSADRKEFQADGTLKIARPLPGEHDNVVFDATCDYRYTARLHREPGNTDLVIRLTSGGRPDLADGCATYQATERVLTCTPGE